MIRTFDSTNVNIIANDPDVRPFLGDSGPLDFTDFCADINNFCIITECGQGCYLLHNIGNGKYITHTLAMKPARGRPMAELMRDGFKFMFTNTDCVEISTYVPDGNTQATKWTNFAGFRPTYRREDYFNYNGTIVGCQFYTMTIDEWVTRSKECQTAGEEFHEFLEAKLPHDNHPEDITHNKFVGFAALCVKSGNVEKGIVKYNEYAKLSGYEAARIISLSPIVINIQSAILQQYNGQMEVLKLL